MNVNDIYKSGGDHLKAADLQRDVQLTIAPGAELVNFDDGDKIVIGFENTEKTLVLNKTNARMIAEQHGGDVNGWAGKPITIGPDRTSFNGQMVPCIRVRYVPGANQPTEPAAAPQQGLAGAPDDAIPF